MGDRVHDDQYDRRDSDYIPMRPPEGPRGDGHEMDHRSWGNPPDSPHASPFSIPKTKKRPAAEDFFEGGHSPGGKRYNGSSGGRVKTWGNNVWVNPEVKAKDRGASFVQPVKFQMSSTPQYRSSSVGDELQTEEGQNLAQTSRCHVPLRTQSPPIHPDRLHQLERNKRMDQLQEASRNPQQSNNPFSHRETSVSEAPRLETQMRNGTDQNIGKKAILDEEHGIFKNGRSHSKNVEMDPRKNGRKSSTTQHTLDSGNASPQSAVMEIDTSVTRSENQTPITSMFVSGGPGSFSHQSREPAKDGGPDNLKQLMETLLQFTKSVTTMATVTVQRDTARAKAEKQVTEYQRWRRHHESFTSLAEEHDKEMAKAKQHTERMDERLKRHEHARDSAIRMMAATMLAVSSGSAIPKFGEDDQKKQLEWELKDVKAELDGIKNTLANTVRSINDKAPIQVEAELKNVKADLRDNAIALSNLQETVIQSKESVQTKQARLSAQVNELEKKVIHGKSHTDLNAQIQDSLGHFSNEMAHLKERADSYDNLKLELSKTQARVNDLSNDVSKEQEGLLALKNEMTGDGQDDPGLFDLIAKQEANIENFGQTLKRFNEELNGFNEDVQQHGSRITSLESISSTTSAKASLAGSNPEIKDMIATVAQDLTELREDQEKKDEMVAEDAEKLSKSLNALETEVELLRQQYTEVINSQHTRSLEAQSQDNQSGMPDKHLTSQQQNNEVLSGSSNLPQEHVNLAVNQDENSVVKLQAVLAIHRAAIEDYRERLITCEAFTFSLQQRYDNLTTEHLARSMVNQMQTMYPYAANTQTEIESAKDRLSVMTHEISQLSTILATITKRLNNTELESIQSQGSDIMVLKDRLVRLSDDLTGNLRTLTDQVDSLKEDSKVNTEKLHALNETLNESVKLGKRELGEIESTKEDIDQLQRRFENYEETTVTELASLHGQVALLNDQAGIASFESEAPADLSESGESDDLPSATVLIANASANSKRKNTAVMDGVRMEQAQSPESPVVKTLLLKRKDQSKRRRGGSDDSGSPGTRKKPAL